MNRVTDREVWIESEAPLADTTQWAVPLRVIKAVADGEAAELGIISPLLAGNLETISEIYAAWIHGKKAPLSFELASGPFAAAQGVSLFFSGGVDSFYSLVKHREEIDNLILIHGFDIPLSDSATFAQAEAQAREAARLAGKHLIIVRTNLHWEQPSLPGGWGMYHGAALAAIAHALAPNHGKIYIASSYAYADLHPWGSHPLMDRLWSTETLKFIHDGGESRIEKLHLLLKHPEALMRLRVCWENEGNYNCGLCEKCVRTMLGLRAVGMNVCTAFPDSLTPQLVRGQKLSGEAVLFWRELLDAGLPPALNAAVRSAIHSHEAGLPPRSGELHREINRWRFAAMHAAKALFSPIDRFGRRPVQR